MTTNQTTPSDWENVTEHSANEIDISAVGGTVFAEPESGAATVGFVGQGDGRMVDLRIHNGPVSWRLFFEPEEAEEMGRALLNFAEEAAGDSR